MVLILGSFGHDQKAQSYSNPNETTDLVSRVQNATDEERKRLQARLRELQPSNLQKAEGVAKTAAVGLAHSVGNIGSTVAHKFGLGNTGNVDNGGAQEILQGQQIFKQKFSNLQPAWEKLGGQDRAEALRLAARGASEQDIKKYIDQTAQKSNTQKKQLAGDIASVGSLVLPVAKTAQLAKGGIDAAKALAVGGTSGAVGGAGFAVSQNPNASIPDIAKNAAIGAVAGAALPLAGAGVSKLRNSVDTVAQDIIQPATQPIIDGQRQIGAGAITDKSRLIGTGSDIPGGTRYTPSTITNSRVTAGTNPGVVAQDIIATSRAPSGVNRELAQIQNRITEAQQTGNITADEARSLMQRRQDLIDQIDNPTNIDHALAASEIKVAKATQSGDNASIKSATTEHQFLQEEIAKEARQTQSASILSGKTASPLETSTPMMAGQSLSTEAKAVKNGLTSEANPATYGATNWDIQSEQAVNILNTDEAAAKRIAFGQQEPPPGVLANAVYKAVENRAIKNSDSETIRQLVESQAGSRTSRYAQELGVLGAKDPESPVVALLAISKARQESKLAIPKTITKEESANVTALSQQVARAKTLAENGGDRLIYGRKLGEFQDYVNGLKAAANKSTLKESLKPVALVSNIAGLSKSLRASLDNSVLLRQGWKTLFAHPGVWAKNSLKSFQDIARTVGGKEVLHDVRADVLSRANARNGMYERMKIDVFGNKEEAFPTSLPEKIPIAGRAFKASEAAFTGWQQRTRADLADKYLEIAQKSGVDLTSKKELESIGKMVNSLTSRGHLGRVGERSAKLANNVFFSPRLFKSSIDVLTAHQFQKDVSPFVRKRAAMNLLKIVAGTAAVLKLADEVKPGSVEYDPRSSDFGKIRVGDTRFDVSGGMGSIVTLGSRMATQSSKSSTSGEVKKLNTGEFGSDTTLDVLLNFTQNKLSPVAGVVRDYLKGQDFNGNKVTPASTIRNLVEPLILTNYREIKSSPNGANALAVVIADGLGISANTYAVNTNWSNNPSKELTGFKQKVGQKTFDTANKTYNDKFNTWFNETRQDPRFAQLSQENRLKLVTTKKSALKDDVLKQYGYEYKPPKRDKSTDNIIKALKDINR